MAFGGRRDVTRSCARAHSRDGFKRYADIAAAARRHARPVEELPYALRVLLENLERQGLTRPTATVTEADLAAVVAFEDHAGRGLALAVPRVILPDSSGVPALQDLAALRDAIHRAGGDAAAVDPRVPVDVIVDHSLQVDRAGTPDACIHNMTVELERNAERYRFLRWAQGAFAAVRVFPPGSGIIHQINLEHIAEVVRVGADGFAYPDFVIGGDSHTPMVNGLGVLGWGVGGIDAVAAMLGQDYVFSLPGVAGVELVGSLPAGSTTTDLALHVTQVLRAADVVGCFVEFFGPAAAALSVPERATLANMAPEYGASAGYFPIDRRTVAYVADTRSPAKAHLVDAYARANTLFRAPGSAAPAYPRVVRIDLADVRPSVAGPKRPQDRLDLAALRPDFTARLARPLAEDGFAVADPALRPAPGRLGHGSVAIAAITSCTNTSNPRVMLAAGLVAQKAAALGLTVPAHVKTSLAPGSRAVTLYLEEAGLLAPLERLGFHVVGYGCTTCGGKSGPLGAEVAAEIEAGGLVAAAVLSGNRNFEGRIHRLVRANYIMSPPLVVAFALAGRVDIDLTAEPLAHTAEGRAVHLSDLWPSEQEIAQHLPVAEDGDRLRRAYADPDDGASWGRPDAGPALFPWDPASHYLVEPPFLAAATAGTCSSRDLVGARVLGLFGDSLTTDHISPGGEIPADSEAGRYLLAQGIPRDAFNSYVARRGNHHVMTRATFANLRIKNRLVPGREGGWTRHVPSGEVVSIFEAARRYREAGVPMIVMAGCEYGTGSSRDWAAKGTALLGVRAVIAGSFERIHRSNLIGLGVLPLAFDDDASADSLGLDGSESYDLAGTAAAIAEGGRVSVTAHHCDGRRTVFAASPQLLNDAERRILSDGGVLPRVFHAILRDHSAARAPSHGACLA
ncbi:MAG: aconitate hydratase AcnA [Rhodospirillaceae bacterium]|nr:aconitate hydratase AcnA [Rhodospirillaceae bacterium]